MFASQINMFKLWKRSLLVQIVGSFSLLSLAIVALLGYLAFSQAKTALKESVFNRLTTAASLKEGELNRWLLDRRQPLRPAPGSGVGRFPQYHPSADRQAAIQAWVDGQVAAFDTTWRDRPGAVQRLDDLKLARERAAAWIEPDVEHLNKGGIVAIVQSGATYSYVLGGEPRATAIAAEGLGHR